MTIRRKVVTGMREVLANMRTTHKNYGILWERGVLKGAKFLVKVSLELCPIDTGDLRKSIFIEVEGEGFDAVAIVGYAMFYAIYVHENLENYHPIGQAKYLEQPIREYRTVIAKIIFDEMKKSRTAGGRFAKVPKESRMILHSGGDVLVTYLISTGVVTAPSAVKPWPMMYGSMPSGTPDEYSSGYDTAGIVDGRYMGSGKTIDHPGILLRFRGRNARSITKKILEVCDKLDKIDHNSVTIEGKAYILQSCKRTTSPITLGPEEGTGRLLFTVNGLMTYFEKL